MRHDFATCSLFVKLRKVDDIPVKLDRNTILFGPRVGVDLSKVVSKS